MLSLRTRLERLEDDGRGGLCLACELAALNARSKGKPEPTGPCRHLSRTLAQELTGLNTVEPREQTHARAD